MITFREFKIFIYGMITAFVIALAVYNSSLNVQKIIAQATEGAVITATVLVIFTTFLSIIFRNRR